MEKRVFNPWWLVSGLFVVAMVAIALFLNFNYNNTTDEKTDGIDIDNGDTKINWNSYPSYEVELSGEYNITAPGTYYVSGSTSTGGINLKLNDNAVVRLVLDNVSIKNPSGPAIACYGGEDLVIEFIGVNYLEDGSSYIGLDEDVKGSIYSKADLTLKGDGILNLTANYQDGIVSKDDLKINGGTYNITAADDGIRGKDSVYIMDGKIDIAARGDAIKSNNTKDMSKGFVLIAGGAINVAKSYEGLEARMVIIDDGDLSVFSNDDGINAGQEIQINGGNTYINAAGDGVDSNSYLYINGGSLIVDGPTNSGNGALDAENGIYMDGGKVIAVGAAGMASNLGASSSIYNVSIYFDSTLSKGTLVEIENSDGETIISHISAKTFSHMAAGDARFTPGETYIIYVNGVKYDQFTISEVVTTIGSGGMMRPGAPGPGNAPGGLGGGR